MIESNFDIRLTAKMRSELFRYYIARVPRESHGLFSPIEKASLSGRVLYLIKLEFEDE